MGPIIHFIESQSITVSSFTHRTYNQVSLWYKNSELEVVQLLVVTLLICTKVLTEKCFHEKITLRHLLDEDILFTYLFLEQKGYLISSDAPTFSIAETTRMDHFSLLLRKLPNQNQPEPTLKSKLILQKFMILILQKFMILT